MGSSSAKKNVARNSDVVNVLNRPIIAVVIKTRCDSRKEVQDKACHSQARANHAARQIVGLPESA